MSDVLVTGGGGFLGYAICRQLVARGASVRTYSRKRYAELDALGAEQHTADLSDIPALRRAAAGCEAVFHTAAKAGIWGPETEFHDVNVTGTGNVLAACLAEKVPLLIHTSTPSVVFDGRDMENADESAPYPEHFHSAYSATKATAEQMILAAHGAAGLRTIALRPHLIWGPRDPHILPRLVARARAGQLRRIGDGSNRVDTTYIDDAAHAHLCAADALAEDADAGGRAYFISQGEPWKLWDLIGRLLESAGAPPVKGAVSAGFAVGIGAAFETAHKLLRLTGEPRMTRFVAREMATSHWFNISAARDRLGYRPQRTIEQGLAELAAWCREHPLP